MRAKRLVFLGAPGTGKGTQAARMSRRFGLVPMSSGDTLRNEIRAGSAIGKQAARYVQAGTLVPDEIVTGVMLAAVERLAPDVGFILDGFPRTLPQAEALAAGLARRGLGLDGVIDFRLDDATIVARIVSRRVCSACGATYNTGFSPPAVDGVCDRCGGQVTQRVDDREDVVRTRLETYRRQTAPLIEYYTRQRLLRTVDAAGDAAAVEAEVARLIEALG